MTATVNLYSQAFISPWSKAKGYLARVAERGWITGGRDRINQSQPPATVPEDTVVPAKPKGTG